ncbi:MAG: cobalt/nickel transport system permease protein [Moorella sp. (in: firmicutes)]|jgi:cobalt/nickel transport system permease protein|uniref:energy-coupling factor transporter transmembrane component T family protein n=1 Tax=unclassified Neomoorella TaxID=2676739 RepID=UPI0010FFBFB2|nr:MULTISPECIES: energy-coupling factor transporter transmembrane component T [unclassified Moorella (in: firmicutes)]MDK2815774.1 cobalt/nickel transport system permease protein [Moorella sp. (in: firmicutes)]MDK2894336.1 cobalt/nickel transport system permease protein [Moorella sp. (in: firmicutes)]GEA16444.1 hypothetical protein E308F_26900 [Moorella sp. E308F]GEA17378.1 hypothetical protein E306M_05120 [Moorella sp. E306M]
MHLADIDYLAFRGHSFWHRASATAKILFTIAVIAAVVLSSKLLPLVLTLVLLLALLITAGIPLRRFVHILFYPAFLAGVFAMSLPGNGWTGPVLVILKAITAATSMVLLLTTTGVPAIFACLRRWLPPFIADALFLTYRSFFILLDRLDNFLTALKVKGGYNPLKLIVNMRNAAAALGVLLIHSLDTSERMYHVLALRGYRPGSFYEGKWYQPTWYDLGPLLAGLAVLLWVVML